MTTSYCVKQKKRTECVSGSEKIVTAKTGRKMMKRISAEQAYGPGGGGGGGFAAPPNFGKIRFFGRQEKIWAKPVFKDVSMMFLLYLRDKYFLF